MMDRRSFLQSLAAGAATISITPEVIIGAPRNTATAYFGIHPFIENNPSAVFIMRTNVDQKTNGAAIKQVGLDFGKSVFLPKSSSGIPTTHRVAIKPNLTCRSRSHAQYTVERSMGIVTDVNFVEGVIESLKSLGFSGSQFHIREVNCFGDFADGGYVAMASRTGADIRDMSGSVSSLPSEYVQWMDVPEGTWFTKIPFLWPVNAPDTFLLNIAKLKTHGMGVTLCAKNLQGTIASGYVSHCTKYGTAMNIPSGHVQPTANAAILSSYNSHVAKGIPRWDRPGSTGGIWQETWATRCLDNNSITTPALHIVEGVYGRDGNFMDGPSPEGLATDYMTNMIIFGKNPFHVDCVGHWLAGHEPGNFGLFHMAIERGLASILNPLDVPVYDWNSDGTVVRTPLKNFNRWQLKTYYLQRDYNGQNEQYWHLVNEPYNYPTGVDAVESNLPKTLVVRQNYPNPFNSSTSIEFIMPQDADVRVEVIDVYGQVVDVLVDGFRGRGSHLVRWDASRRASGIYFYRARHGGGSTVRSMVLIR